MKKLISVMLLICLMVMPVATSEEEIVLSDDAEMETGTIELDIADEFSEPIPEDISALDLSEALLINPEDSEDDAQPKENDTSNTGSIAIDESNFPDENFRAYVLEKCDMDSDGLLSASEISNVTEINVSYENIGSLEGIEYFTKVTYLNCEENNISELDLNSNPALVDLRCNNNSLTSLNISNCQNLTTLSCRDNYLSELDISGNPRLADLGCSGNKLKTLDLSNNDPVLAKAVREYGPMIWEADSTVISFIHPDAHDDVEGPIGFDRSVKVYANGELLYSPDKPLQRTVKPVTLGAGETDKALLYYKGEKEDDTPYWIRILLSDGKVTYKSSNSKKVKVDNKKGTVKGVKRGEATVTVTSSKGVQIKCAVTVKKAPSKVSLSKNSMTIMVEDERDIKVKLPSGTASRNLTWSSSNPGVAKFYDYHGTIRANAPGTAIITVKTYNGKKATCKVTVVDESSKQLDLCTDSLDLHIKETFMLVPIVDDGSDAKFTFTSDDTSVATVSSKGIITAKKAGSAEITVEATNGMWNYITVYVKGKMKKDSEREQSYTPGASGIKVYATARSKYYHSKAECSGMTGASRISLETALAYGKKACPVCLRGLREDLNRTVYALEGGSYYHSNKTHAGNKAQKYTWKKALAYGMYPCPVCG